MAFLTFDLLISQYVLIVFYTMGAIICPFVMWRCMKWLLQKYPLIEDIHVQGRRLIWEHMSRDKKWKMILLFVGMFMMAEIFWRMMFEYLIAFMQMREALVT